MNSHYSLHHATYFVASLVATTPATTVMRVTGQELPAFPGETDCQHLTCKNGGYCEYLTPLGELDKSKNNQIKSELYCICPLHWAGPTCEVPAQQCDDSVMYCYNRATCEESNDNSEENTLNYTCDCSLANLYALEFGGDELYSGVFCEHPSTVICANDIVQAVEDAAFCANNGECTIKSDG